MKNASPKIQLELTVDEINLILTALGQMSYVQVAGIIDKISKQAESQWQVKENKE